jgi:predicted glycosyltransferase
MNVLIDISHPAHVHFYRHLRQRLLDQGAAVRVVARAKDVTVELLTQLEIPHFVIGEAGRKGWLRQLGELIQRDLFLMGLGVRSRPDLILTRNPSGVQAARALGVTGVFDTDDGRSVGIHYLAAAPFAHVITAPDCLAEPLGDKGRLYPSYKALAYLHPAVFQPDAGVRSKLGPRGHDRFAVLRLVAHDASHDRKAQGIDAISAHKIVDLLEKSMPVFISAEGEIETSLTDRALETPAAAIHDVLAEASIVVGDSQSVITEAALLGTPAIRVNSYVGSTPYLAELEERYELAFSFAPSELDRALGLVQEIVEDPHASQIWAQRRDRMLADKVSLTDWYLELMNELV